MQELLIVTTGGTIDKVYFDDKSDFQVGEPQIGRMLEELGVDPGRVDLVYSGNDRPEDLDAYARLERTEAPTMLFLGRLVPHKHVEQAVDLLADRADTHPDLELHIVGGGYWESTIAAHAARRVQGASPRPWRRALAITARTCSRSWWREIATAPSASARSRMAAVTS